MIQPNAATTFDIAAIRSLRPHEIRSNDKEYGSVKRRVGELLGRGHLRLLLNLSQVPYTNSWGVGELATSFISVRNRHGKTMMHFRNAKYDVEDFEERIGAVEHTTTRFLDEVLLDQRNPPTMEEAMDVIDQLWALQIVHTTGDRFITSDNPSLMFTTGDGDAKHIVALMLPITPDMLAVVRRRAATEAISDMASKEDVGRFNALQAVAADRFVFSAEPLKPADLEQMRSIKTRLPFVNGVLAQDWWRPNALNKFEPGFSFIAM